MSDSLTGGPEQQPTGPPVPPVHDLAGSIRPPEKGPGWAARLTDRTLWVLLAVGLVILLAAIGFAFWINAAGPLHPVPVASRPSA